MILTSGNVNVYPGSRSNRDEGHWESNTGYKSDEGEVKGYW